LAATDRPAQPDWRRHAQHHGGRRDSFPFKNKTAEANLAGARIQKEQLQASTRSQEQIIEVDVRNSAQAVESARQRVLSAREARVNAEMQLEGEQRLYQVGRSTTFLLFQRENALANARASELRAETDYNKALADLQRATSTTLRANNVVVTRQCSLKPSRALKKGPQISQKRRSAFICAFA
jgi:outer membrane protein TolC